jgi:hypothetical protein
MGGTAISASIEMQGISANGPADVRWKLRLSKREWLMRLVPI